ncbi:hypothetical protein [Symbiopectobacterium sp. RP]|uniref:hypothetical protein n=1 Tax=Symbiopectobacterium sp. RP TaxID=3248553 RepID=UPI003D2A8299
MGTSKKQKKREWLRYRDFVLSPYGVIKIKSLGYKIRIVSCARDILFSMQNAVCYAKHCKRSGHDNPLI